MLSPAGLRRRSGISQQEPPRRSVHARARFGTLAPFGEIRLADRLAGGPQSDTPSTAGAGTTLTQQLDPRSLQRSDHLHEGINGPAYDTFAGFHALNRRKGKASTIGQRSLIHRKQRTSSPDLCGSYHVLTIIPDAKYLRKSRLECNLECWFNAVGELDAHMTIGFVETGGETRARKGCLQ